MGYFGATLDALYVTFRQALKKPTTVQYPTEQRERAPRFRASFALTHDAAGEESCIGCKKCENICPSDVIRVAAIKKTSEVTGKARGYAEDFTLNLQACIICELCVQVCPTDAIIMTQEQEVPGFSREDLVLTMDKLYANEKQKRWAWSNATILGEQQDPDRGVPGKEKSAAEGSDGEEKKAKPEKPKKEPKKEPKAEGEAKPKKEAKATADGELAKADGEPAKAESPKSEPSKGELEKVEPPKGPEEAKPVEAQVAVAEAQTPVPDAPKANAVAVAAKVDASPEPSATTMDSPTT
ncbi:MAG: NADH-quinone oxidoreductase subunit I [Deltaproteobacteria bacterium]|nr:NADH-quinone oxidoreductase subunit I [Deltaproteobacteria bacterium]